MDANGRIRRQVSLAQYKSDITNLREHPDFVDHDVSKLTPRAYKVKETGVQSFGLIAEEVEEAGLTGLLTYGRNPNWTEDSNEPKEIVNGVAYHMLSVLLLDKLKELQGEVAKLKNKA